MKINWSITSVIIMFGMLATPVFSINLNFLDDAVIGSYNEEDIKLMKAALKKTLDNNKDGEITTWKNPKTGNGGAIAPANTFDRDDMTCRRVKIINRTGDKKAKSTFNFCKIADGTWKIASK